MSTVETFSSILEEELGYTNTSTYPSAPATVIDLPEVAGVDSEFFYNYYTEDERTVSTGVATIVDIVSANQNIEFAKLQSQTPRSAIIAIEAPRFDNEIEDSNFLKGYAIANGSSLIDSQQEKIVFEGAIANTRFSSLILQDNQVDETFYHALTGSIAFVSASHDSTTDGEMANLLSEYFTSPISQQTASPSTIKKVLADYQPVGVAYAPTDARYEVIADAMRDVRFVEFSFTVNNAVAHNMVLGGLEDRGNIYQDELISIEDDAKEVQAWYVTNANPGTLDSSEFELELAAIEVIQTDQDFTDQGYTIDETSIPIGLYIEKSEVQMQGTSFTRVKMDPIVINSYGSHTIFDSDIKYGATYVYNVKIIYLTAYEATAVDPDGITEDERVFAISMVASEGVKTQVIALENIAPPPPKSLKFNYNFSSDALDIFWEEPTNPQRDVVRYQVFRRDSTDLPFTLLAEFDFDNSTSRVTPLEIAPKTKSFRVNSAIKRFRDTTFEREKSYIYALACVDARGLTSSYSEQVSVIFDSYKNKINSERISWPNAPKPYPNLYLDADLFVDNMSTSGASRMRIFFDPEYYDLVQTEKIKMKNPKNPLKKIDKSLDLIAEKYKLQIINIDLQDSDIFDISISDETGPPIEIPLTDAMLKSIF